MATDYDFHPFTFQDLTPHLPQKWQAIPGMQWELGDTGFRVELLTQPRRIQGYDLPASNYILWSPEGRMLNCSPEARPLKELGSMLAGERDELHKANGVKYQLKKESKE